MHPKSDNKRAQERRSALAPARLVPTGADSGSGEVLGDLMDVSDGGAAMEIANPDAPLSRQLREREVSGVLHVLLPDGDTVVEMAVRTVWLVEHAFGSNHRLMVGMRIDGSPASLAAAQRLVESFPPPPDDSTVS